MNPYGDPYLQFQMSHQLEAAASNQQAQKSQAGSNTAPPSDEGEEEDEESVRKPRKTYKIKFSVKDKKKKKTDDKSTR